MHAPIGVIVNELELGLFAEDARDTAVAKKRCEIVSVRTHSEILIVDQIKLVVIDMNILAMIITVT